MKPPLLFYSGWGFPPDLLRDFQQRANQFCDCTVLDAMAYTRTESGTPLPTPSAPYFLGGWSLGALVAMDQVLHNTATPAGLILCSPTACFCARDGYPHGAPESEVRALTRVLQRHPRRHLTDFMRQVAAPRSLPDTTAVQWIEQAMGVPYPDLSAGLDYLRSQDLRDEVGAIRLPTLVMHGSEDAVIPVSAGALVHERVPGSLWQEVAGAGHDIPFSAADFLLESLSKFIERHR